MDIYDKIKKSRVYSYIMTTIAVYWLSDCLQWVYSLDIDNLSPQALGLAGTTLAALLALLKMIFTFAATNTIKDK